MRPLTIIYYSQRLAKKQVFRTNFSISIIPVSKHNFSDVASKQRTKKQHFLIRKKSLESRFRFFISKLEPKILFLCQSLTVASCTKFPPWFYSFTETIQKLKTKKSRQWYTRRSDWWWVSVFYHKFHEFWPIWNCRESPNLEVTILIDT